MSHIFEFKPLLGIKNPHSQTLLSYLFARKKEPLSENCLITLQDQDRLSIEITTPNHWQEGQPIVLMAHGIGGSHKSPYLVRLASTLSKMGYKAARMNFRGFGSGKGLARHISHGGSTADLYAAITHLKDKYPNSPLYVIGFSLSGNILLKLAGEKKKIEEVDKLIAVCPPLDLAISSKRLELPKNRIYQNSIVKSIIQLVESPKSNFIFQPSAPLKNCKTLREFDNLYTAPASGFKNADDYYHKCSSSYSLKNIEMPCKILFSKDDPLIDCSYFLNSSTPSNLDVLITKYGGHMGFLGYTPEKTFFWMDSLLVYWLKN